MQNNTFKVAKWEIKKNINSKTFLFMTFIFPLLILLISFGAGYIGSNISTKGLKIGIIDQTDYIYQRLYDAYKTSDISISRVKDTSDKEEIKEIFAEKNYDGIVLLPKDIMESNQAVIYYKELRGLESDVISNFLSNIIIEKRLLQSGYSAEKVLSLTKKVNFSSRSLKEDDIGGANIMVPIGLAMLMAFSSMFSGSALMQSISKEKSDKLVETLFSSLTPQNLMYGKVIGYALLGICQIIVWGIVGIFVVNKFFAIPLNTLFNLKTAYMLIYFLLGFIMISGLNAIAGASGKDLQSSGQSMSGLLVIIPIVPFWFSYILIQNPSGTIARVFSYIPFFTSTTMLMRIGISSPPAWEIVFTMALLLVFGLFIIKLASKIFRVGMLMYGKKLSLREIIKWSKA